MSQVIDYLEEHGPSPLSDLPAQPSHADRRNTVSAVKWRLGGHGAVDCTGGHNAKNVYYLRDKHDRRDVIKAWLKLNPTVLESNSKQAVYNALTDKADRSWKEPLASVWEENGWSKHHGNNNPVDSTGGECPLCGEAYSLNFPDHRRRECEA